MCYGSWFSLLVQGSRTILNLQTLVMDTSSSKEDRVLELTNIDNLLTWNAAKRSESDNRAGLVEEVI